MVASVPPTALPVTPPLCSVTQLANNAPAHIGPTQLRLCPIPPRRGGVETKGCCRAVLRAGNRSLAVAFCSSCRTPRQHGSRWTKMSLLASGPAGLCNRRKASVQTQKQIKQDFVLLGFCREREVIFKANVQRKTQNNCYFLKAWLSTVCV